MWDWCAAVIRRIKASRLIRTLCNPFLLLRARSARKPAQNIITAHHTLKPDHDLNVILTSERRASSYLSFLTQRAMSTVEEEPDHMIP